MARAVGVLEGYPKVSGAASANAAAGLKNAPPLLSGGHRREWA